MRPELFIARIMGVVHESGLGEAELAGALAGIYVQLCRRAKQNPFVLINVAIDNANHAEAAATAAPVPSSSAMTSAANPSAPTATPRTRRMIPRKALIVIAVILAVATLAIVIGEFLAPPFTLSFAGWSGHIRVVDATDVRTVRADADTDAIEAVKRECREDHRPEMGLHDQNGKLIALLCVRPESEKNLQIVDGTLSAR